MTSNSIPPSTSCSSSNNNPHICRVCGDFAATLHYGALTCEGCNQFYRRTVDNLKKHPNSVVHRHFHIANPYDCTAPTLGRQQFQCTIPENKEERRQCCKSCRYERCIRSGMIHYDPEDAQVAIPAEAAAEEVVMENVTEVNKQSFHFQSQLYQSFDQEFSLLIRQIFHYLSEVPVLLPSSATEASTSTTTEASQQPTRRSISLLSPNVHFLIIMAHLRMLTNASLMVFMSRIKVYRDQISTTTQRAMINQCTDQLLTFVIAMIIDSSHVTSALVHPHNHLLFGDEMIQNGLAKLRRDLPKFREQINEELSGGLQVGPSTSSLKLFLEQESQQSHVMTEVEVEQQAAPELFDYNRAHLQASHMVVVATVQRGEESMEVDNLDLDNLPDDNLEVSTLYELKKRYRFLPLLMAMVVTPVSYDDDDDDKPESNDDQAAIISIREQILEIFVRDYSYYAKRSPDEVDVDERRKMARLASPTTGEDVGRTFHSQLYADYTETLNLMHRIGGQMKKSFVDVFQG